MQAFHAGPVTFQCICILLTWASHYIHHLLTSNAPSGMLMFLTKRLHAFNLTVSGGAFSQGRHHAKHKHEHGQPMPMQLV